MSDIPVPPPGYHELKDSIAQLEQLKRSPGYHEFSKCLVAELVRIFFEFLRAPAEADLIRIQGQGQSVQRILGVVDEQCAQRTQVAAAVDASMEAVRQGRGRNAPAADRQQPWRGLDHAMLGR